MFKAKIFDIDGKEIFTTHIPEGVTDAKRFILDKAHEEGVNLKYADLTETNYLINLEEIEKYPTQNFSLMPLHNYKFIETTERGKIKRGKTPTVFDWVNKSFNPRKTLELAKKENRNIGIPLKNTDLIIDVDPRNFPLFEDSLEKLCQDLDIDLSTYPTVITGTGGFHIYTTKPNDLPIRSKHKDYPGIDFKTKGGYVISAGSVHPDTGRHYVWDKTKPSIEEPYPLAPKPLLNLLEKAKATHLITNTTEPYVSKEQLTLILEALNVEDFRSNDDWFTLMCSVHYATNGEGGDLFLEWSTNDPKYATDATLQSRWDSLNDIYQEEHQYITHRTLYKILIEKGLGYLIPKKEGDDYGNFAEINCDKPLPYEVITKKDLPEHEKKNILERMNDTFVAVMDSGDFTIMYKTRDFEFGDNAPMVWVNTTDYSLKKLLSNRFICVPTKDKSRQIPIVDAWLNWSGRREAEAVIFEPYKEVPKCINLWTGFAYEPSVHGSWNYLNELVHEVLANGDQNLAKYILDWCAFAIQQPQTVSEVALCLRGVKGTGKGTLGRTLVNLAGNHGVQIKDMAHLTGKFNAHLRNCLILFADEAVKPYDKAAESSLKGIITEPTAFIEKKGKDGKMAKNRLSIIMSSNEDWVVPAGMDNERRFCIAEVSDKWIGRFDLWSKLNEELKNGGYSRLLFDLQNRDISRFHPRDNIPQTRELVKQKLGNLTVEERWAMGVFSSGMFEFANVDTSNWPEQPLEIPVQELKDDFLSFCVQRKINKGTFGRDLDIIFLDRLKPMFGDYEILWYEEEQIQNVVGLKKSINGKIKFIKLKPLKEIVKRLCQKIGSDEWL